MKVKYLFLAMAMTVASSASAQFVGGGSSKGGSKTSNTELDPKAHFVADFKIGSVASAGGFGFNLGGTKELTTFSGCTLAWDFLNFEWAAPFNSPANLDMLSLKTGLRLFSPSFANDNLRVYTNLAVGYTCVLTKGSSSSFGGAGLDEMKKAFMKAAKSDSDDDWEDFDYLCEKYGYDIDEVEDYWEDVLWDMIDDGDYDEAWNNIGPLLAATGTGGTTGGTTMKAHHGFGLSWGVGLQIKKKFSIGYTLQYETAFKTKNHFGTISYTF